MWRQANIVRMMDSCLQPGGYHVRDYENQRSLGEVDASRPRLRTEFKDHLLLEFTRR